MSCDRNDMEKDVPFFSVCIPVYNVGAYLRDCVESVLTQTCRDLEIILVDDASTDGSSQLCDELGAAHSCIRVVHQPNGGPLLARHEAVRNATGRYLLFLDADDLFYPNALQEIRGAITQHRADMVVFDFRRFFPDGHTEDFPAAYEDRRLFEGAGKRQFYTDFIAGNALNSLCRKCIRANLYDADEDFSAYRGMVQGEDKLASLGSVDRAERIVYINKPLYGYRMRQQSTTNNASLKNYKDVQIVHRRVAEYIRKWDLGPEILKNQQRRKVSFGATCALSVAGRIPQGRATKQDLREAVEYIAGDGEFVLAYEAARDLLPRSKRMVCDCILHGRIWLIRLLARMASGARTAQKR